ncbi:MAG: tRNA threonylcarbamoyladenosine dehydratase [Halobacteriovorax sp.]|nr:tRNA threonylcarbamoyladenosine dehydratase [Halobacteriovorax sp.]|tara:strand:+ start:111 stop:899 length:789 start_codon:yes stop_codon:yes gene_type:complete
MDLHQATDTRFGGIARAITPKSLQRLQSAHILILGIGGVGSWSAEALARSGVGKISLVDLDDVCITNINRQIHAMTSTVGRPKVEVMKDRLIDIAPDCQVTTIYDFFDQNTFEDILSRPFDMVIDCIDSLKSKCLLINECKKREIPLITVGGAGGKVDPTLIRTNDLNQTSNDQLLKQVRRSLKRDWGWSKDEKSIWGVQAVFSIERMKFLDAAGELQFVPDEKQNRGISCSSTIGSTSWITGSFGLFAASLAVQSLVKRAD